MIHVRRGPLLIASVTVGLAVLSIACVLLLGMDKVPTQTLTISDKEYQLEVVTTDEDQALGLGDRNSLADDHGMLFEYDREDDRCFWMKNMRFAIDIIWVDADKRVTHIEPKLTPDTYPASYCAPGRYIIELAAGEASHAGLEVGERVHL